MKVMRRASAVVWWAFAYATRASSSSYHTVETIGSRRERTHRVMARAQLQVREYVGRWGGEWMSYLAVALGCPPPSTRHKPASRQMTM